MRVIALVSRCRCLHTRHSSTIYSLLPKYSVQVLRNCLAPTYVSFTIESIDQSQPHPIVSNSSSSVCFCAAPRSCPHIHGQLYSNAANAIAALTLSSISSVLDGPAVLSVLTTIHITTCFPLQNGRSTVSSTHPSRATTSQVT